MNLETTWTERSLTPFDRTTRINARLSEIVDDLPETTSTASARQVVVPLVELIAQHAGASDRMATLDLLRNLIDELRVKEAGRISRTDLGLIDWFKAGELLEINPLEAWAAWEFHDNSRPRLPEAKNR